MVVNRPLSHSCLLTVRCIHSLHFHFLFMTIPLSPTHTSPYCYAVSLADELVS